VRGVGVGALPRNPTNQLKYNMTWSTNGLVNEYCNPCEALVDGKKTLLVDEVQSDWHQKGAKEGYAIPEKEKVKLVMERHRLWHILGVRQSDRGPY
jgi:saccharopine dehydrogenase-like NADP-dependent oxidoreductase